ncbi:MAG TPA: hypothetical protein VFV64_04640, partial [Permianibacter sp.]|nr:hypothetical protein [Permianibacter sp.]
ARASAPGCVRATSDAMTDAGARRQGQPNSGRRAQEVDHNLAGFALLVLDVDALAVARAQLRQQRQRVVIVDKAHHFAALQAVKGAENGSMAEPAGNAAGIKNVKILAEDGQAAIVHGGLQMNGRGMDVMAKV